ncbi:MAG: undecaprenyl-phosphate glucose phosphotransferase, partial [Blautia sp.]|nr:undecaprenyl-phosphate glucose phosphotransferase [Blautia sp.]
MLLDILVITLSYLCAWFIRFVWPLGATATISLKFQDYLVALAFIIPGYLIIYQAFSLFAPMRMQGRRLVLANVLKANTVGFLLIIVALYMLRLSDFSRIMILIFYFVNTCLEWGLRMLIYYILRDMRKRGLNQRQMVLIGYSRAAEEYIDRIIQNPQWGYVVRGILDDNVASGTVYHGVKV